MSSTARTPPRPARPTARGPVRGPAPPPPPKGPVVEVSEAQYTELHGMSDVKDKGKGRLTAWAKYLEDEWGMSWVAGFIRGHTNLIWRLGQVAAVLLPLIPSIMLLVFVAKHKTFGGNLAQLVIHDISDVQVVVSVVASILTYLNVLTISSLLSAVGIQVKDNFVFQWLLSNVGFDKEKRSEAEGESKATEPDAQTVSKFVFGGKFSFKEFIVGCICFALLCAPHLIWVGTLTPNVVTEPLDKTSGTILPNYSSETAWNWADNAKFGNTSACLANKFPPFSSLDSCPASGGASSLFGSMLQASAIVRSNRAHLGVDADSSIPYWGRSFGVGAGSDAEPNAEYDSSQGEPEGRDYEETGYSTEVVCTYNTSSSLQLVRLEVDVPAKVRLNDMYQITGNLPNGSSIPNDTQPVTADKDGDAVAWVTSSTDQGHSLAIAVAGKYYTDFHHIQCAINFVPTLFSIQQNYTTNTTSPGMKVSFAAQEGKFGDFHGVAPLKQPSLERTAMSQLAILSQFQSSPYASELGQALEGNKDARFKFNDGSQETLLLEAVADSIAVALDEILLYVARSQMALISSQPTAGKSVQFTPRVQRVQIGNGPWNIAAMIMTGLLLVGSAVRLAFFVHEKRTGTYRKDRKEGEGLLATAGSNGSHV